MVSQVSTRGQVTIDKSAREQLGIRPGMVAYQRVVAGRLEIVFLPAPHRRSLHGVFHRTAERVRSATAEDTEKAVMEALADEQNGA